MYKDKKVTALIAAAGTGQRMGESKPKQFLQLNNKTIIETSVEAFINSASIDAIYVITKKEFIPDTEKILSGILKNNSKSIKIIEGGETRQESVYKGLKYIDDDNQIVLVHDAARPFISSELIEDIVANTYEYGAVIPIVPVKDTIKEVKENIIMSTPERKCLYSAQTPQGFDYGLLLSAYEAATKEGFFGTDDAQLVEKIGKSVHSINGDTANYKITTAEDMPQNKSVVGLGFDVHAFDQNRDLILGGVNIPYKLGLLGHSDADVLTHALMDALLGAMNLGDIGTNFPDTDNSYKDISSMILLDKVANLMKENGYALGNADLVIVAEKPKMKDHIPYIKESLSKALDVDASQISIKATTSEGLGFTGREEGIGAQAIVQLLVN